MRTALFTLSVFSMCFLSGCGPTHYRALSRVYVEQAPQHPNAPIDYVSEVNTIKSLAKPFIPQGAELKVANGIKDEAILTITVTFTDPAEAADICNRIAEAYVAKTKEGVIKTLLEKAHEPSKPI